VKKSLDKLTIRRETLKELSRELTGGGGFSHSACDSLCDMITCFCTFPG
jgi:hypothetical protein